MRRVSYRTVSTLAFAAAALALLAAEVDLVPNPPAALLWAGLLAILGVCFHELAAAEHRRAAERKRRARAGYIVDDPERRR